MDFQPSHHLHLCNKEKDCVLVGVNYRLLPNVTIDKTIDDAAEAVSL